MRPVRLGQELLARPGARAAAARDGPADRDPRPELGLRAARRAARRRPAGPGGALVGAGARHPGAVGGVAGAERLRLRFGELGPATQAALLQLDPVADREEYAELRALLAEARPESLSELAASDRPEARRLGLRLANLGLEELGVWARADAGSLLDALDDPAVRCLVVDTGSLPTREEQALVAESVLRGVWERRRERRPVLLVIDEAHNVCPAAPGDVLTALATEHAIRIAGEGRKFGIYMLVATQRPQKVHENVISQCDNLVLMRLNSAADAGFVAEMFGFAPPGLVGLATDFRLGEALVAGKLASHPAVLRFGARVAREGGGDVDAGWAAPERLGDRHRRPRGEDADGRRRARARATNRSNSRAGKSASCRHHTRGLASVPQWIGTATRGASSAAAFAAASGSRCPWPDVRSPSPRPAAARRRCRSARSRMPSKRSVSPAK